MLSTTNHLCHVMPLTYSPIINHCLPTTFHCAQSDLFDPASYRVTVRPIVSCHTDVAHPDEDTDQTIEIDSELRKVPVVPFKRNIAINDGTQLSSTSFTTTSDDQKSSLSDINFAENAELVTRDTPTCKTLIASSTQQGKSNDSKFCLTSLRSPSVVDIAEEKRSLNNTIDVSYAPTLPSSQPLNIEDITSNEISVHSPQSVKSITSSSMREQKPTQNTSKTSLGLRHTRSTVDFALLFDDADLRNLDK
ncbi:unnamed protein product [Adineta ricciae]|uniref:Uncharacterized protein n=1 Tax=Adineta ricciae TaxID=249248 RepID=A0A813Y616_ADIRI|nr:unnamed protein product [Adineta ricciae]